MKMPILEIRKQAKDALKGKWGKAIGAIFSEYGILYAASMVAVIIFYVIVFVGFFAFFAAGGFQQENLGASPFMIIFPIALVVIVYGLFFLIYAFLHPLTLGKNKWFYDNLKGIDQSVGTIFHF